MTSTRKVARSSTRRANRTSTALKVRRYRWVKRPARDGLRPTITIAVGVVAGPVVVVVAVVDQAVPLNQ
jgi:hypothetical protein